MGRNVTGDLIGRQARFWRLFPLYALFVTLAFISSGDFRSYLLNITFLFSLTNPGLSSSIDGWLLDLNSRSEFPAIDLSRIELSVIAFFISLLVSVFYVNGVSHAYAGDDGLIWMHHIQAVRGSVSPKFWARVYRE